MINKQLCFLLTFPVFLQKLNFSTMISYGVQSLPNAGGLLFPRFSKYETTGQLEPSGLRVAHKQCGNSASEEIYPR